MLYSVRSIYEVYTAKDWYKNTSRSDLSSAAGTGSGFSLSLSLVPLTLSLPFCLWRFCLVLCLLLPCILCGSGEGLTEGACCCCRWCVACVHRGVFCIIYSLYLCVWCRHPIFSGHQFSPHISLLACTRYYCVLLRILWVHQPGSHHLAGSHRTQVTHCCGVLVFAFLVEINNVEIVKDPPSERHHHQLQCSSLLQKGKNSIQ